MRQRSGGAQRQLTAAADGVADVDGAGTGAGTGFAADLDPTGTCQPGEIGGGNAQLAGGIAAQINLPPRGVGFQPERAAAGVDGGRCIEVVGDQGEL